LKPVSYYFRTAVLLSGFLSAAAFFFEWGNPLRWILIFWFLLICPGLAFYHLLPGGDELTRFFLVIVVSLSMDSAVALGMLYLRMWSPGGNLGVLLGLCLVGVLWQNFQINHQGPANGFSID
jgi:hypothetical protein